jgi:ribosomal protein L37AE/L43A
MRETREDRYQLIERVKKMAMCPKCGGEVRRVSFGYPTFRWTCVKCQRNYGYNTERPMFMEGWRLLTKNELVKTWYLEGKTGDKDIQGENRHDGQV